MKRWEAEEANVTGDEAIAECRRHGIVAVARPNDQALVENCTGELIAMPDGETLYSGADVLQWLGY
ncbi:hypothetical protein FS815_25730 [Agrobacterium vitis]|uniref:hypothetical protein n=1 Tax=Allorhizobium ampelinum TaxID=3025782 RepID=UPI001F37AD8E|nr:hypothetical protein [Allorhizobium ampelinum]MCF1450192.1 hypothetical protein [Allorhizobium ampelinum]